MPKYESTIFILQTNILNIVWFFLERPKSVMILITYIKHHTLKMSDQKPGNM